MFRYKHVSDIKFKYIKDEWGQCLTEKLYKKWDSGTFKHILINFKSPWNGTIIQHGHCDSVNYV